MSGFHPLHTAAPVLRVPIPSTPYEAAVAQAVNTLATPFSKAVSIESSPYEIDPDLCRAFVAGLLESGPSRERAADAIGHWCAERGIDPAMLLATLAEALTTEGGAR